MVHVSLLLVQFVKDDRPVMGGQDLQVPIPWKGGAPPTVADIDDGTCGPPRLCSL